MKPIAYINVEKRTLEFAEPIKWHTPTVANLDRIPLFTKEALAQTQEPVAWLITDEKINSLQVDSIQRLVDRARHAHMTDIKLRINGQDEWHQADWLKHLTRTTPTQRTWIDLTRTQMQDVYFAVLEEHRGGHQMEGQLAFGEALQAKLKEENT